LQTDSGSNRQNVTGAAEKIVAATEITICGAASSMPTDVSLSTSHPTTNDAREHVR
jgi:hypothetical protein